MIASRAELAKGSNASSDVGDRPGWKQDGHALQNLAAQEGEMVSDGEARNAHEQSPVAQGVGTGVLAKEIATDICIHGEDPVFASAPTSSDVADHCGNQRRGRLGLALAAARSRMGGHGRNVYPSANTEDTENSETVPTGTLGLASAAVGRYRGSMPVEIVATDAAPKAIGPYSQAVIAPAGRLLFCSGQLPIDPRTGELAGAGDIHLQTHRVMKNLEAVLQAAGASFADMVKSTIYLVDLANFAAVNEIYAAYFTGAPPPARATVQVAALPRGAQVEIDAIVVLQPA